jgi:hypothetical protein
MAIHDHERPIARDYMWDARTNRASDGSGFGWIGAVVFLLLLVFVFFLFLAAPSQDPTGGKTVSPSETALTTAPARQPK